MVAWGNILTDILKHFLRSLERRRRHPFCLNVWPFSLSLPLSDASISGNSWVRVARAALFSAELLLLLPPTPLLAFVKNVSDK